MPRRQSLSSGQGPLNSPRDAAPSPRSRVGHGPGFDGVLGGGDTWVSRRKAAEGLSRTTSSSFTDLGGDSDPKGVEIKEEEEEHSDPAVPMDKNPSESGNGVEVANGSSGDHGVQPVAQALDDLALGGSNTVSNGSGASYSNFPHPSPPQPLVDLANVEWSYLDPQGNVQGTRFHNVRLHTV